MKITKPKLQFKQTCFMCPEQYDVFLDEKQVAYVRLRWGCLTVEVPDVKGKGILEHNFNEEFKGSFKDKERELWLKKIEEKILEYLKLNEMKGGKMKNDTK